MDVRSVRLLVPGPSLPSVDCVAMRCYIGFLSFELSLLAVLLSDDDASFKVCDGTSAPAVLLELHRAAMVALFFSNHGHGVWWDR